MRGFLGSNVSYLKSYSGRVCIDAAKQAEVPVQVGADLRWEVITKGTPEAFNGVYLLLAQEPFEVQATGGSPASVSVTGAQTKAIILRAQPGQSAQLHLLFPNRTALPKGIRLIRPGYTVEQADKQVFTTEYIDLLKKLNTGCIRLMDVMRTNGSECTDSWCDPSETLWGVKGRGAPLQPMIVLAKALDADAWVNIPHKATDLYVRNAALTLLAGLAVTQRVYLEYSNEAWNTAVNQQGRPAFPQTNYVRDKGDELAKTDNRFFAKDRTVRGRWFYANRASEIASIFMGVFKGQEYRVVPMLAGQTGDSSVLSDALGYGWKPKAVAVAGYFNAGSPDPLWSGKQMEKFAATAVGYEKLIYEWTNVNANVNDPANAAEIEAWAKGATAAGVSMACHFVPLADPTSKYAATNEAGTWTAKCEALASASLARPHPYAEKPPEPDPRDVEIASLKAKVAEVTSDFILAADTLHATTTERDALRVQLTASTDAIGKANAELNAAQGRLSAIKLAGGWS